MPLLQITLQVLKELTYLTSVIRKTLLGEVCALINRIADRRGAVAANAGLSIATK